MQVQIKFTKTHGDYKPGDIGQCDEDTANALIAKGLAVLYDPDAEKAAADAKAAEMQMLAQAVVEQVKTSLLADAPAGKGILSKVKTVEPEGAAEGFKSMGDFAMTVKAWSDGKRDDKRALAWLQKTAETGLTEGIDSDGGFLVPEEFSTDILKKTYNNAALVSRCRDVPMQTKAVKIPYVKETSRADGSRQGGIRAYRANELGALSASKPTFGAIRLEVEKLYVYVAASEELLEDASAMGSMISAAAADELSFKMDWEVINGTGAGMPLGILNAPCLVSVAKEALQGADTILMENIVNMWSRCYGPSRANAVWLINQDIEPQLFTMSLAVGMGGIPVYMPANGLAGSPYGTLMGRPVIPCEQCDTLGDKGDIFLADFSQYLYARHVSGINAATSIHLKFDYDQTVFRFVVRTDGQPWWPAALTPNSGSTNTLSPFVTLAERA